MKNLLRTLFLSAFLAGVFSLSAADYFWVGGAGNWSDINHWATTSGGTNKHTVVPGMNDNVFFDENSGFTAYEWNSNRVTMDVTINCKDMIWRNAPANPEMQTSQSNLSINIYGNMTLQSGMKYTSSGTLTFFSPTASLTTNGVKLNYTYRPYTITIPAGVTLTVKDNLTTESGKVEVKGALIARDIAIKGISEIYTYNPSTLDITGTTIDFWEYPFGPSSSVTNRLQISDGTTFISSGSTQMTFNDRAYIYLYKDNLALEKMIFNKYVQFGGKNISIKEGIFNDGASFDDLMVFDKLTLSTGGYYYFRKKTTINTSLNTATQSCGGMMSIVGVNYDAVLSSELNFAAGASANLHSAVIKNLKITGDIPLPITASNSVDNGNNTNITFAAGTPKTLYWIGGDGSWNDPLHWSVNSDGTASGGCVPTAADNVIFNANSGFTATSYRVKLDKTEHFCNDITFSGLPVNIAVLGINSTKVNLNVYGSMVLQNGMEYKDIQTNFLTSTAASLTTNGALFTESAYSSRVNYLLQFGGTGTFRFNDNVNAAGGKIQVKSTGGTLIATNIDIRAAHFETTSGKLDISGSTVTTKRFFINSSIPIVAGGSVVSINGESATQQGSLSASHLDGDFNAHRFDKVLIHNGYTHGSKLFAKDITWSGICYTNNCVVVENTTLSGGGEYAFSTDAYDPYRVTKSFNASLPDCSGVLTIKSKTPGTQAVIDIAADATVNIKNTVIKDVRVTGAAPVTAASSVNDGNNTGINFSAPPAGKTLYWIGGAGNWSDPAHWTTHADGSPSGGCLPTFVDNVVFNANSGFTAASNTVTLDQSAHYCVNMHWENIPVPVQLKKSSSETTPLYIYGNAVLYSGLTTLGINIVFMSSTTGMLTSNGSKLNSGHYYSSYINFAGSGAYTIQDNLEDNSRIQVASSVTSLTASGITIKTNSIVIEGATPVDISNSTISLLTNWDSKTATVNAANSQIIFEKGSTSNVYFASKPNNQFNTVIINTDYRESVFGSVNAKNLFIKNNALFNNGNVTVENLSLAAGKEHLINPVRTLTVTKQAQISGNPCFVTQIKSDVPGTQAKLNILGGATDFDYVSMTDIDASGSYRPLACESHSTNGGNNTNMTFKPYDVNAPIKGFGTPNIDIANGGSYPYTLKTDGFYPGFDTTFKWNDGSTDATRAVGPGTYSITVTYAPGCAVTGSVTVGNSRNLWKGASDKNWAKTANWTKSRLPNEGENIEFATEANNMTPALNDLTLDADRSVTQLINATADKKLIIPTGRVLTVTDSVKITRDTDKADAIVLLSDRNQPNAALVLSDPAKNPGLRATVQFASKSKPAAGKWPRVWQYFGSPVKNATLQGLFGTAVQGFIVGGNPAANSIVRRYEQALDLPGNPTEKWADVELTDEIAPYRAYEITQPQALFDGNTPHSFKGELVTDASETVNLTIAPAGTYSRGNYILANPYTAPIYINNLRASDFGNLHPVIYLYNAGSRQEWLDNGGNLTGKTDALPATYTAIPINTATTLGITQIPSMQGFLLTAVNAENSSFTFRYATINRPGTLATPHEPMRVKTAAPAAGTDEKPLITMDVLGKNSADRLYLITAEGTTKGYDSGWDAYKFLASESAQLYALSSEGKKLQVSTDSTLNDTYIGFRAGNEESYTLKFSLYNTGNAYDQIFVQDLTNGNIREITDGLTMSFAGTTPAAFTSDKRFKIIARNNKSEKQEPGITLEAYEKSVLKIHNNTKEDGVLTVYNFIGQPILVEKFGAGTKRLQHRLPKGIYILNAKTNKANVVLKTTVL